jgi:hypothetical protein
MQMILNEISRTIVDTAVPVHRTKKQLLTTYLRSANKKLGLLLNFGAELMKDGIFRIFSGIVD